MSHFVVLQVQPAASRVRTGGRKEEPSSHEFLGLWGPSGGKSEVMKKICPVLLHQGSHVKVLRRHLATNQRNLSPSMLATTIGVAMVGSRSPLCDKELSPVRQHVGTCGSDPF